MRMLKKLSLRFRNIYPEYFKKTGGFTLIEILIVAAITVILGTAAVLNLPTLFKSTYELDAVTNELRIRLVSARQNSIAQNQGAQWGVRLNATVSGNHNYQVFHGDSFATGTIIDTVALPKSVVFLSPVQGNINDIIFARVTGVPPVGHSITLALASNNSIVRYISVLAITGVIAREHIYIPLRLSVSLSPASATVSAGNPTSSSAAASVLDGVPSSATFSVSGLPNGVIATFNPLACTPNCSATMNLTTSLSTPAGVTVIPVQVGDGMGTTTANFTLTVNSVSVPLSGWAWSSNIGWISFNCENTSSCATVSYSVQMNSTTGIMSGYAWAPNIGWLDFNVGWLGCPSGTCEARITNGLTGTYPTTMTGWAKILSTASWMHLAGTTTQDTSAYGVSLATNGVLSGWAWDSTTLGWVSFNCSNTSTCATVDYASRVN